MSNNIEELRLIYESGTSFNENTSRQIAEGLRSDSLETVSAESTRVGVDSQPILPKLRKDSFLDLLGQGVREYSSQKSIRLEEKKQRSIEKQKEFGEAAAEALETGLQMPEFQPTIQPIKELVENMPGREMYMDIQRQNIANVAGLPVDLANSLLHLLGVETSNKPFFGSKHVKESLDWMFGSR